MTKHTASDYLSQGSSKRIVQTKHASLLGLFVSYKESEVLWIGPQTTKLANLKKELITM
jgi:hypothetical protein